jgi:hypothetical protein
MKWSNTLFRLFVQQCSLVFVLLISNICYAGWGVNATYLNTWDEDNKFSKSMETSLFYDGEEWYNHLELAKPLHPLDQRGTLELQTEYILYKKDGTKLVMRNELLRDMDDQEWAAELTPKLYTKVGDNFKIGIEVELDYITNNYVELSQIEIEPTIKWSNQIYNFEIELELEAPVMRLYSNDESKKDFEFEEVLGIFEAAYPVTKNLKFIMEFKVPYNMQTKESGKELLTTIQYDF